MADATTGTTAGASVAEQPKADALEKKRTEIITTPTQFEAAVQKWQGNYNLLTPFTQITGLAPKHGIIASVVKINPDPAKGGPGEVYNGLPFLNAGEVAIAKIGLRKIAEGAGISTTTFRVDPRTIANYWEVKAVATYRGIDGTIVTREATMEWDLRDGSPRLKGWTAQQVSEGRKNGLRNCETRAINAAIREFGIKQKYTQEELRKPFLVIRVAWQPDPNNADDMRLVGENSMRGTSLMYGAGGGLPPHAQEIVDADVVDDAHEQRQEQPRHVGSGQAASTEKADTPKWPEGFGLIAEKPEQKKITKLSGGTFPKWFVVDHHGVVHVTTKALIAEDALRYFENKTPVRIASEENEYQEHVILKIHTVAEPGLPGLNNL